MPAGGAAMIEAARDAAEPAGALADTGARPMILAVTVLTSLDAAALAATGVADDPARQVVRLGRLAMAAGADGLVCSAHEVAALRDALGSGVRLVVPGIRPADSAMGDQARTMTPRDAVAAGADWIVVGRPITGAADPAPRPPRSPLISHERAGQDLRHQRGRAPSMRRSRRAPTGWGSFSSRPRPAA